MTPAPTAPIRGDDVPALIAERNAAFVRNFRARDAQRLVDEYFVPDALQPQIYPAGGQPPVGGRATLVARFAGYFDTLEVIEPQTHAIDHVDGMAVETGRARLVPRDAAQPVQLARYLVVWVPTPAGWRAKTDFFAADGWPDAAPPERMQAHLGPDFARPTAEFRAEAAGYGSATWCDVAPARLLPGIAALAPTMRVCGPAFTVQGPPGDALALFAAMRLAQPGDVLVVDGGGETGRALLGEVMLQYCRMRGIAGVVVHGAVRDVRETVEMGYPVFASGCTPAGPTLEGGGKLRERLDLGGVAVAPGDWVVGDGDGVVVVAQALVAHALPALQMKRAKEERRLQEIASGDTAYPAWLRERLEAAGFR